LARGQLGEINKIQGGFAAKLEVRNQEMKAMYTDLTNELKVAGAIREG
jgi:hypothetical protein